MAIPFGNWACQELQIHDRNVLVKNGIEHCHEAVRFDWSAVWEAIGYVFFQSVGKEVLLELRLRLRGIYES